MNFPNILLVSLKKSKLYFSNFLLLNILFKKKKRICFISFHQKEQHKTEQLGEHTLSLRFRSPLSTHNSVTKKGCI